MTAEDGERRSAVTCDGRLFHRRAAATGNALSPTVDRRVRRTSRDVNEAERTLTHCLLVDVVLGTLAPDHVEVNEDRGYR